MDKAHLETDKMLVQLENEIKKTYFSSFKTAKNELEKVNSILSKYKDTMTESDRLRLWNEKKRLEKLITTLTIEIADANITAIKMLNDELLNVFDLNYSYGAYMVENLSGYEVYANLYNRNTIKKLLVDNLNPFTMIAIDEIKDKTIIYNLLKRQFTTAIINGESIDKITKRIQEVLDKNLNDALRIARTETTRIESLGRQDAFDKGQEMGLKLRKKWVSTIDSRTRESHILMQGEVVDLDKKFSNGLDYPGGLGGKAKEVVNCFIGETIINSDSPIKNSFKHWYEGDLIRVKTSSGIEFTGTPNHPILTNKGWVSLGNINKFDNLIKGYIRNDFVSRINPNVNCVNTSMINFHNSVNSSFVKRVSGRLVNFHGYIPNTYVEIKFIKSFLQNRKETFVFNMIKKINFKFSSFIRIFFSSFSFFNKFIVRNFVISPSFIRFFGKLLSIFKRSFCHSDKHRFTSISNSNIRIFDYSVNNTSADIETLSKCLNGFTGSISLDNVVFVERINNFKGHVYNLHTENNLYIINSISQYGNNYNGIISHNCRCSHITEFVGVEKSAKLKELEADIKKQSFEEWQRRFHK